MRNLIVLFQLLLEMLVMCNMEGKKTEQKKSSAKIGLVFPSVSFGSALQVFFNDVVNFNKN